jgi:hypothetical protein
MTECLHYVALARVVRDANVKAKSCCGIRKYAVPRVYAWNIATVIRVSQQLFVRILSAAKRAVTQ